MNERTKKLNYVPLVIIGILIILGGLGGWLFVSKDKNLGSYTSLKGEIVKVTAPRASQAITSPLAISGEVRGNWSFEANLPASLTDVDGNIIVEGFATLQGDWMTSDYVPFSGTLAFTKPVTIKQGYLVLKKDNPSGLASMDDAVKIPVRF